MTRVSLPKIEKLPADARALAVLREQIVDGAIPPGLRLTEVQLSEEMGLSRATIRTALHQLAKEGLVSLVPYTGWTVVRLTRKDVWELFTLRSSVERLAAGLAATRQDTVESGVIGNAFEALEEACKKGDASEIAEADFAFHKAIIVTAGHDRLATQYALIEQQIRVFIRSSNVLISDPREILEQHQPIYAALKAGDQAKSAELCEIHCLNEGEKLLATIIDS